MKSRLQFGMLTGTGLLFYAGATIVQAQGPAAVPAEAVPSTPSAPLIALPVSEPEMRWSRADATALLSVIEGIGAEGLMPADYEPGPLRAAIASGEGPELNAQASKSFSWLVEDMRDGRTPMPARVQWFAVDPDQDKMPTATLMMQALQSGDIAGTVASLAPTHTDYKALKDALAVTPESAKARRTTIRINMDRWRWLTRDLGTIYLMANVPEFQLRLMRGNRIVRTYRTVVGKPGRTATPQLAEQVEAVVFNPTWTVPQSIVKGEGLGARLLANPASARAQGYKVSRAADGTITVVQQPGANNSLGFMKIDMPNPHAIYLHDTPSRHLFNNAYRAYSHGCIRTQDAVRLGMTMAILGADMTPEEGVAHAESGKYTRVVMTKTFPVYIAYFTMGVGVEGQLSSYADIYGRDAPVVASFNAPRQLKTTQRKSSEAVIKLDNPL